VAKRKFVTESDRILIGWHKDYKTFYVWHKYMNGKNAVGADNQPIRCKDSDLLETIKKIAQKVDDLK
jgi:hypothetical protein